MEFDLVKNGYRMINMYKSTMDTARNGRDTVSIQIALDYRKHS